MKVSLKDGTGSAREAKIDSNNKLQTKSVAITEQQQQAKKGKSYQVGTGIFGLTDASESAIMLITNNENEDILISGINIMSKAFTGSSDNVILTKMFLGSTDITSSTILPALNNNFGSSRVLDAIIKVGAQGSTIVGGTAVGAFFVPVNTFFNTDVAWILPKGTSIGITFTPGTGNTLWYGSATLECMLLDKED